MLNGVIEPIWNRRYVDHVQITVAERGQYETGVMPDGTRVPAYRQKPGVAADSRIETFVALKLMIDSWRWGGVPFCLRTGKRLPGRFTEVMVQYKHAPNAAFKRSILTGC